jgi:hypothetical protein
VLDPNFLKTVSPDLIVAYFNNAKPEDLKAGVGLILMSFCLAAKVFFTKLKVVNQVGLPLTLLCYPSSDTY